MVAYNGNLTIHNVMMLTPMWRGLAARYPGQADCVRRALAHVAAGRLRFVIDRTFPLAEAAAAHRHLESGKAVGKIVLTI
jgi:NADPH:quinone reductase-like Zn-dependent oxidoreductase